MVSSSSLSRIRFDSTTSAPANARATVAWAASNPRSSADLEREVGLLERYLASLGTAAVTVELAVVRNAAGPTKTFALPQGRQALLTAVRELSYDGGTQLAALTQPCGQ